MDEYFTAKWKWKKESLSFSGAINATINLCLNEHPSLQGDGKLCFTTDENINEAEGEQMLDWQCKQFQTHVEKNCTYIKGSH